MMPAQMPAAARERLAARARRVARIRRSILAGTLAAFVLAWGVIAFDGSMGAQATATSASPATTTSGQLAASSSSTDSTTATPDAGPVTTAQS
jgi:hypothetical protein